MTVGDLRSFLASSSLPDHAQVLVPGRHSLHACRADEANVSELNRYGQAQPVLGYGGLPALVMSDVSRG